MTAPDIEYAALAIKRLESSERPASGESEAVQGVGYALLAIHDRLTDGNALTSDLIDQVHAMADQIGDLQVPAGRIAGAAERPPRPRWWFARRREPGTVVLTPAETGVVRQALADATIVRLVLAGHSSKTSDKAAVTEYSSLLVRLGGAS